MKIESAQIAMQSTHVAFERERVSVRLERWEPRATPPSSTTESTQLDQIAAGADEALDDPRMTLLRAVIESMFGRSIQVLRLSDLEPDSTPAYAPPERTPTGANTSGMSLSVRSERIEYEHVGFAAKGLVRTADGREIRFEVEFELERSFAERFELDMRTGEPRRLQDPLVLDFAGSGARLADVRFAFDLDADGTDDAIPLPIGGRGMLAFDRNANGRIDDGSELFGPTTGDGFAELATLDSDGNGWIDEADAHFADLRLWQPDVNGKGSLTTLAEAGVGALSVARVATPFALRDGAGDTLGQLRASGVYLSEDGTAGTISQIDLAV